MLIADCFMACGLGGFLLLSACHHPVLSLLRGQLIASCLQMLFFCLECWDWKSRKLLCLLYRRTYLLPAAHEMHYLSGPVQWSSPEEQGKFLNLKLSRGRKISHILQGPVVLLALSVHSCNHFFFRKATVVLTSEIGNSHDSVDPDMDWQILRSVLLYPVCILLEYDPAQLGWAKDICVCFSLQHPQKTHSKPQGWHTVSTGGLSSYFSGRTLEEFVYLSRLAYIWSAADRPWAHMLDGCAL